MTVDAGTIEYKVAADVSGLQAAESAVDKSTKGMEKDFKKTDAAVDKVNTTVKKMPASIKKANVALGGFGRKAGQAGVQVQQFVGQVQGGQDVMLAFSQQAADFGIVLGAPLVGAILGIAGAIGGALLPSLFDSRDATEELEAAMESLTDVMVIADDGTVTLSDSIVDLAKISAGFAKAKIFASIASGTDAVAASLNGISEASEDAFGGIFELSITDAIKLTERLTEKGIDLENLFKRGVGTIRLRQNYHALKDTLEDMSDALGITEEEAANAFTALSAAFTSKDSADIKAYSDVITELSIKYGLSNKELQDFAETTSTFAIAAVKANGAIETGNELLKDLESTLNKTTKAEEKLIAAQAKRFGISGPKLNEGANERARRELERTNAMAAGAQGIQGPVKGQAGKDATTRANLLGDADPAMAVKEQEFAKLEALRSARETELITEQEFDAARIELAQKTADKLNAVKTAAIDKDTETIKGGLAVVGALAEAGLVDAKHAAIAQAAFSLATNIAKASEIGFPANLPFIAGAISQGAQIKSIISGASGKALGGGVDGSSAYRVGEQGPEILQSNGMNYLLPGQNGTVVSNQDAFGGNGQGAGVTVNIINQSSAVNVSQRKGADALTYEVLIQDIDSGNGPLSKSLSRSTNIGRRTS